MLLGVSRAYPRSSTWAPHAKVRQDGLVPGPRLESPPQRELDETRRANGLGNLPECRRILHIRLGRVGKVSVVPNVEEISRETQDLILRQLEILNEREVPVLLVRPPVDVPAEVTEVCAAEVRVRDRIARRRVEQRCGGEVICVQVAVEAPVDITTGHPSAN